MAKVTLMLRLYSLFFYYPIWGKINNGINIEIKMIMLRKSKKISVAILAIKLCNHNVCVRACVCVSVNRLNNFHCVNNLLVNTAISYIINFSISIRLIFSLFLLFSALQNGSLSFD